MQWAIPALSSVEVLVLGESGPRSEYGEWRMQNTVGVMYLESDLAIMEEISNGDGNANGRFTAFAVAG